MSNGIRLVNNTHLILECNDQCESELKMLKHYIVATHAQNMGNFFKRIVLQNEIKKITFWIPNY
jgi:hypothetical protein